MLLCPTYNGPCRPSDLFSILEPTVTYLVDNGLMVRHTSYHWTTTLHADSTAVALCTIEPGNLDSCIKQPLFKCSYVDVEIKCLGFWGMHPLFRVS